MAGTPTLATDTKGPYFGGGWLFGTPGPLLGETQAVKPGRCPQAGGGVPPPASFFLPLCQRARRPWVTLACPCPCCPRPHPPPARHRGGLWALWHVPSSGGILRSPFPGWLEEGGPGLVALPSGNDSPQELVARSQGTATSGT